MRKQRNIFQMKEQDKNPEKNFNKMEVSNLSVKDFKVIMVIKIITELGRKRDKHRKKVQKI